MTMLEKLMRLELNIEDVTADGQAIGHHDGLVVFTDRGLIGDRVLVEITAVKKRFAIATTRQMVAFSERRRPSPCPHSDICDGCFLMAMPKADQLEWKRRLIESNLRRLGGTTAHVEMLSYNHLRYRNKVNLRIDASGRLAYSKRKTNAVFAIETCAIAQPEIDALIQRWNRTLPETPGMAAQARQIRMAVLRANAAGETLIALVTGPLKSGERQQLFDRVGTLGANVLCTIENARPGDVGLCGRTTFYTPAHTLQEKLAGLSFEVSPASFFQVNTAAMSHLYSEAISLFSSIRDADIIDLYCGTGTTSLLLARHARHVYGVEVVSAAVSDARENARRNGITNVDFICDRAESAITHLVQSVGADRLIVDPPRAGMDRTVLEAINHAAIREMVYISCNPSTLARDIMALKAGGFEVGRVIGIDQFPNTGHVETVCLLSNRKPDSHIKLSLDMDEYYDIIEKEEAEKKK